MPVTTIGDMSQHFQSVRNTGSIKTNLARLSQEMSSGQVADIGKHLNGDTSGLLGLNHEISLLEVFSSTNSETARMLEAMQLSLQKVDTQRETTSTALLLVNEETNRNQIVNSAQMGRNAFVDAIASLNSSNGGRAIFSGTVVDQVPLSDPETLLSDILAAVGTASTKEDIVNAIDDWFDAPGGGFETLGYLGGEQNQDRAIDESTKIEIDIRADDPDVRELLKGFAYVAVAHDLSGSLTDRSLAELSKEAGLKLFEASDGLSNLQSSLGGKEESVEVAISSNSARMSSFEIARSDLIRSNPFETATKLQDIQTQLETHFAVTARLSRLNLMDFLR